MPSPAVTLPRPVRWSLHHIPENVLFPPGICLWDDAETPAGTLVSVDGSLVAAVVEAELGPHGRVILARPAFDGSVVYKILTGHVEAWRCPKAAVTRRPQVWSSDIDPALSGPSAGDTLPA